MRRVRMALVLAITGLATSTALGQSPVGTAFTYQAELRSGGVPITGAVDLRFRLYDAATGGVQVGGQVEHLGIAPVQGRASVLLDFGGAAFNSSARWLEIEVRNPATTGTWSVLTPRQGVTPAPVTLYAVQAESAANAAQFNGQSALYYLNAGNLTGTLPGGLLGGTYAGAVTLSNVSNSLSGNGANLTGLNAGALATGTVADARLSSNVARLNTPNVFSGQNAFLGNVTVGSAAFSSRLSVVGADSTANGETAAIRIQNPAAGGGTWLMRAGATGTNTPAGGFSIADANGYKLAIASNGNIGIGTNTPAAPLHASGAGFGGGAGLFESNNSGNYVLVRGRDGAGINDSAFFSLEDSGTAGVGAFIGLTGQGAAPAGSLRFAVGGAERVRIGPNGVVGIGSSNPVAPLHVDWPAIPGDALMAYFGPGWNGGTAYHQGNQRLGIFAWGGNPGISLGQHNVGGYLIESVAGDLSIKSGYNGANGEMMRIKANGRVGLGTALNPGAQLSVRNIYPGPSDAFVAQWSGPPGSTGTKAGRFENNADQSTAVYGIETSTTADPANRTYGVYGQSNSPYGIGVFGSGAGGGYGGYFMTIGGGISLYAEGTTSTDVLEVRGGADLAEHFQTSDLEQSLLPGTVVMLDEHTPGAVVVASGAYSRLVAGVVSGANDLRPGMVLGKFDGQGESAPIALSGRVWTLVDASETPVAVGDLLTTSSTPGHAMAVVDHERARGAVIGKAMSPLPLGKRGLVLVLVSLQ